MQANVTAMGRAKLEELAARPNTTVLEVSHERTREPWPSGYARR